FWDEQYSLQNVRSLLATQTLEPASGYYPSPVFNLPPTLILWALQATGDPRLAIVADDGNLTANVYYVIRFTQAFFGLLGILLIHLVGRRLISPTGGLLAATTLAFMPWHIHASGYYKPDALLVFGVLWAFHASLRAVERPTVGRHLVVGFAIAIAMSAKLTGGFIALPITCAALILGRHERRRLVMLTVAGGASALFFILMNPYWMHYLGYLSGLQRDYAMRADWQDMQHWQIPVKAMEFFVDANVLGWVGGVLGVLGLVVIAVLLVRRERTGQGVLARLRSANATTTELPPRTLHGVMALSYPVVYTLAYSVQTAYFKPNNFLPVVPFVILGMVWLLLEGGRRLGERVPRLGHPVLAGLVVLLFLGCFVPPGPSYVYRSLTPTTADWIVIWLNDLLRPRYGRWVLAEQPYAAEPPWEPTPVLLRREGTLEVVDDLDRLDPELVELADVVVRRASRIDHVWQRRIDATDEALMTRALPEFPKVRGPELVAIVQPWLELKPIMELETQPCIDGACPPVRIPPKVKFDPAYTFVVVVPYEVFDDGLEQLPPLRYGRHLLEWHYLRRERGQGHYMMTRRVAKDREVTEVRFEGDPADLALLEQEKLRLNLVRWKRGG
ncbi:MAG: glycosyltransferase family 39 protein, partial [Acidobacteriota bacterium]